MSTFRLRGLALRGLRAAIGTSMVASALLTAIARCVPSDDCLRNSDCASNQSCVESRCVYLTVSSEGSAGEVSSTITDAAPDSGAVGVETGAPTGDADVETGETGDAKNDGDSARDAKSTAADVRSSSG